MTSLDERYHLETILKLLEVVVCHGRKKIVEILIEVGADVNGGDGVFGSALQAAAFSGNEEIAEILIKAGADVNATGGNYGSALQAAAFYG